MFLFDLFLVLEAAIIKTISTIFHDFIDRLLVLIDIVWNRTSQIYYARIALSCQNFVTECNKGSNLEITDGNHSTGMLDWYYRSTTTVVLP